MCWHSCFLARKHCLKHCCCSMFIVLEGVGATGLYIQASLERLQLEYVDLVFCHRPDITTPIEETVRAMNFVIEQGWAFYCEHLYILWTNTQHASACPSMIVQEA